MELYLVDQERLLELLHFEIPRKDEFVNEKNSGTEEISEKFNDISTKSLKIILETENVFMNELNVAHVKRRKKFNRRQSKELSILLQKLKSITNISMKFR